MTLRFLEKGKVYASRNTTVDKFSNNFHKQRLDQRRLSIQVGTVFATYSKRSYGQVLARAIFIK